MRLQILMAVVVCLSGALANAQQPCATPPNCPPVPILLPGTIPPLPGLPGTGTIPPGGIPSLPGTVPVPPGTGQPARPPSTTEPSATPPTTGGATSALAPGTTGAGSEFGDVTAGAGLGSSFEAVNMLGHLLLASRSVSFRYNRAAGPINVADTGSTSIANAAISEDNSPLPRDRISFRYNHFDNSQGVTGFGPPVPGPGGVLTTFAQSRNFNLDRFTFQFEKTFLDQLMSVEFRLPFNTTLSSDLDLSAGTITGTVPGGIAVSPTPQNTLGHDGTQLENMTLILKGLLYRSQTFNVSSGLGVLIPTGSDTHVLVTDYSGGTTTGTATLQRVRDFRIENETWALSPFLAFLGTPTERFFYQGFVQFDFPLNTSTIHYTESLPVGTAPPFRNPMTGQVFGLPGAGAILSPPFAVRSTIQEQPLVHIDVGTGYWVVRDPSRTWITGIAPSLELHYTSTLKSPSIVNLPQDGLTQIGPGGRTVFEAPSQVGNQRGNVDILDMTVATTFLISERATLAIGAAFPLRNGDNRTFDWEAHLQLNYYFGGTRPRFAPNF
jgi:hypothetical protein